MLIKQVIYDYLEREVKLRWSTQTYLCYLGHSKTFLKYFNEHNIFHTDQLNRGVLTDWVVKLRETCANSTINKRVGILRRALEFSECDVIDVVKKLGKFKEVVKSFKPVKKDKIKDIKNFFLYSSHKNKELYHAIIILLFETGVRRNELINIFKSETDLKDRFILLKETKSKQERHVLFSKEYGAPIVRKLLKNTNNFTPFLLYNEVKNRAINYADVRYALKTVKESLGLSSLHTHMFRHTFGTNAIQSGVDIRTVQKLMGHSSADTTLLYVRNDLSFMKQSFDEKYINFLYS